MPATRAPCATIFLAISTTPLFQPPSPDTKSTNAYGPAANAGFRLGVGRAHKNIEVRFSYMKGINEDKPNVYGVGALFNF